MSGTAARLKTAAAAALAVWTAAAAASAAGPVDLKKEFARTSREALDAWRDGRFEDADKSYKYLVLLSTRTGSILEPTVNRAILAKDAGDPERSLAQWLKASVLEPHDAYILTQLGWAYLANARYKDARKTFWKAARAPGDGATVAEAKIGLGITDQRDGDWRSAIDHYREAFRQSEFVVPTASLGLARSAAKLKRGAQAIEFYKQALAADPLSYEAEKELGMLYQDVGSNLAAWQAFQTLLLHDPEDTALRERADKLLQYVDPSKRGLMFFTKLTAPLKSPDEPAEPFSPEVKVGLYADPFGKLGQFSKVVFQTAGAFHVQDDVQGRVLEGSGRQSWQVSRDPVTGTYRFTSSRGVVSHTTRSSFEIVPDAPGGSVQLREIEFLDPTGLDLGDREVRGRVRMEILPDGLFAVNILPVEEFLMGAVAERTSSRDPAAALQAHAVVLRTLVRKLQAGPKHKGTSVEFVDSVFGIPYRGLHRESVATIEAVRATRGWILSGDTAGVDVHANGGGYTAQGVAETDPPLTGWDAPWKLERFLHAFRRQGTFYNLNGANLPSETAWIKRVDGEELRRRQAVVEDLGRIRAVIPAKRSADGRVLALKVVGDRGEMMHEGAGAVTKLLSPGSLRSLRFVTLPLYKGKELDELLLWGGGTGSLEGLSHAGAVGLASHRERAATWQKILDHYFPHKKLLKLTYPSPG